MADQTLADKIRIGRENTEKAHKTKCEELKKIPDKVKARELHCKAIETQITALAKSCKALDDMDIEIYQMLMDPDCLYFDSPIAPSRTYSHLKNFMMKKDMDFIGLPLNGKEEIKSFYVIAQEVSGWIMRFAKPKPLPKHGLAAFTEENE